MAGTKREPHSLIGVLIFSLYFCIVWAAFIFQYYYEYLTQNIAHGFLLFALSIAVSFILIVFFTTFIFRFLRKLPQYQDRELSHGKQLLWFCIFSAISLFILFLWYLAAYPGIFSPDSFSQYNQAVSGEYNDWHPVWHTLVTFTLPLKLFGRPEAIVAVQVLAIAFTVGYLGLTVYEYSSLRLASLSLAYLLLNPYFCRLVSYPWKDIAFGAASCCAMICALRIYLSPQKWEKNHARLLLTAFWLANAFLFRHNGVLFSGSLLFALIFIMNKKRWIELLVMTTVLITLVQGPVYSLVGASSAGTRPVELVGLPLTVIFNVAKESPEALDEETAAFVDASVSREILNAASSPFSFNNIKFQGRSNVSLDDYGDCLTVVKMAGKSFAAAPVVSMNALVQLTNVVYGVEGSANCVPPMEETQNPFGDRFEGNAFVLGFLQLYSSLVFRSVLRYICYLGVALVVMLAFILARSSLCSWEDWKRIILCLPIFIHNFGTMLLLSDRGDTRFFYLTFFICPLVVLIMLKKNRAEREKI